MSYQYHHHRIVQLCPISGPYYAVYATDDGPELWFTQRIPALALVDEWYSDSAEQEKPGEGVDRIVLAVNSNGDGGDFDLVLDKNLLGLYWAEDLKDPEIRKSLEEAVLRRRAKSADAARRGALEKQGT